jgi:hypothetical protein
MPDYYDLIFYKLVTRGLEKKEAGAIVGLVRMIEEGVEKINEANYKTEPEFVFIATAME